MGVRARCKGDRHIPLRIHNRTALRAQAAPHAGPPEGASRRSNDEVEAARREGGKEEQVRPGHAQRTPELGPRRLALPVLLGHLRCVGLDWLMGRRRRGAHTHWVDLGGALQQPPSEHPSPELATGAARPGQAVLLPPTLNLISLPSRRLTRRFSMTATRKMALRWLGACGAPVWGGVGGAASQGRVRRRASRRPATPATPARLCRLHAARWQQADRGRGGGRLPQALAVACAHHPDPHLRAAPELLRASLGARVHQEHDTAVGDVPAAKHEDKLPDVRALAQGRGGWGGGGEMRVAGRRARS